MRRLSFHHCQRALSLVELLVVLAILGFLLALLMPALSSARECANAVRCLANLKQLGNAVLMYPGENQGWLPIASGSYTDPVYRYFSWVTLLDEGGILKKSTSSEKANLQGIHFCPSKKSFILKTGKKGWGYYFNPATAESAYCISPLTGVFQQENGGWITYRGQYVGVDYGPYRLNEIEHPAEAMLLGDGGLEWSNSQNRWNFIARSLSYSPWVPGSYNVDGVLISYPFHKGVVNFFFMDGHAGCSPAPLNPNLYKK